jgi:hypothetical protein
MTWAWVGLAALILLGLLSWHMFKKVKRPRQFPSAQEVPANLRGRMFEWPIGGPRVDAHGCISRGSVSSIWSEKHQKCVNPKELSREDFEELALQFGIDRDEHGCNNLAGYFWSEERNECIKPSEIGIHDPDPSEIGMDGPGGSAFEITGNDRGTHGRGLILSQEELDIVRGRNGLRAGEKVVHSRFSQEELDITGNEIWR